MTIEDHAPLLTILTPSWNRAHLLPRLHRSILENLPSKTLIEWLIVDDGSDDNTQARVAGFETSDDLSVVYSRREHGGKHRALNAGFAQAKGDWILIVDSDDWFLPQGLDRTLQEIQKAASLGADALFLSMQDVDRIRQRTFARPGRCVTLLERIEQDPWFDTSFVLSRRVCEARFPEFAGENYLAPGALLFDLDPDYTFYLSDQVCVAVEYQADGLSRNNLRARLSSPVGNTLTYSRMFKMGLHPALRFRALFNFGRFWWHCVLQSKKPVQFSSLLQLAILPFALPATLRDIWLCRKFRSNSGVCSR